MDIYLKDFRERHKISQEKAGESIGIDQRQWSRYEQGINEFPIRYLKALCIYWGESADKLLGLTNVKRGAK